VFLVLYRFLQVIDPLVRLGWRWFGLGNVVELVTPGHRSGHRRSVLIGLLRSDGRWFVGHPNGWAAWTRNLEVAGAASLRFAPTRSVSVRARLLPPGPDRDRAITATGQHPFPGNLIYRLARRHIRAAGVFFELELEASSESPAA
jgi:hypothetical protein